MPRVKPYMKKIPAFYRKQAIDIMLFAHVTALQQYQMPIIDAIQNFRDTYDLTEDDYPMESARVTYTNMRNAFLWRCISEKI